MGFDGFLVPDWAKPYVGWAVGMDWPEGDESRCFRLADACAATARSVAGEGPLSSQGSMGAAGGVKWDGEALKLFAEHVKKVSGGRQAELVDRLVSAALELNQAGVQVEYTKKMIEVSVWFLIFQIGWLLAASAGPWGALSLALIGPRVQLARMTIQQIAHRLLINLALFGGLGVVMDAGVQLSQSRRDGIDWESVKASGMMGALSGLFLTALPAGLSGLSTAGLRAGLSRAEMTAFEKFLAASTGSMWGMMAQSGLANGAATAISLAMSGQFDWEMVLKGTTAGVIGGADAHWAGQPTVRGAGGDGGGPAHGGDGGGPAGGPAGGSPAGGKVPHDPGGPSGPGEGTPAARPKAESIDSLINHGDGQGTVTVLAEQQGPPAPQPFPAADPDTVRPPRPITLRDHESFAQSVATGITGPREPLRTGAESLRADRVTLGDGTRAVDKELAGRDARDREYLTSRLGQAVGADVAAVHIAGERRVLVDWVDGERVKVRLNPDGSWEAPGHHGTADGVLLGLLDTLTSHYDRFRFPDADLDLRAADIDLRVGENGALRAFDHEKAFQGILPDTRNPFVQHFFRETSPMSVEWAGNPLSRSDIEVLRTRIDALEGEFRALGRDDWYANAKFAFDRIAEHAEGTTSLLDAAPEPAGPRSGRTPDHAGGLDGDVPRNAGGVPRSVGEAPRSVEPGPGRPEPAARTAPPARMEPSSGRPDPVGTARPARDAVPAGEDAAPSGGARDRASEGEARDRAPEGEARDAVPPGGPRTPGEVAARP
ncbi:hypothetical protein ACFFR2_36790, partial [Streptosporangium nondiastaticum]